VNIGPTCSALLPAQCPLYLLILVYRRNKWRHTYIFLKYLSRTLCCWSYTIGDDTDVADDGDHTYPIPNEESGRLILVRKSNSSSVIWNYFGGNTGNWFKHVKDKHPKLDLRLHFFSERIITLWNKLDEQTVASTTLNCFKSNLTRLRNSTIGLFLDNSVQRP